MQPSVNETILLHVPENPRLHSHRAVVVSLEPWGAFVRTPAAATGQYRAGWEEMLPVPERNGKPARPESTGDCCDLCGSFRMVWTGTCKTCLDCGTAGGCG